jgi:AcrR family transcriptional regulator
MERIDPRIRRTRKLLCEAFIALIQEKGYEHVTIKDITEKADVAYVTFFRNYTDKDELLMQAFDESIDELFTHSEAILQQDGEDAATEFLFDYVAERHAEFRVLLNIHHIRQKITQKLVTLSLQGCISLKQDNRLIPFEVLCHHLAVSQLALIQWWLENDMLYSPKRMAQIFNTLITEASWMTYQQHALPTD